MKIIPISASPSQTLSVVLASQSCRINIYQKKFGVFADLYVNDALIVAGAMCLNTVLIVRDSYLGFAGDLAVFDTQGSDDPSYTGLGNRWLLGYVEVADLSS